MIGIITDSASDTPKEIIQKEDIEVVPLSVILGETAYKDDYEIHEEECLKYMEHDFAKTTGTPYVDVKAGLRNLINKGYDEIIAINVSSNISNTTSVFQMVAKEIMEQESNISIAVFDTLNISIGSGLLVQKAVELRNQKMAYNDIIVELKKYVPQDLKVYYVIPTLKFLKAGGRIGKVSGTIGQVLNLKPVITVGQDGVYHTAAKARGMKKAVGKMEQIMLDIIKDREVEAAAVYHSGFSSETTDFCSEIVSKLKENGINKIYQDKIVPSMLVHVGPGLVGFAVRLKPLQ